MSVLNKLTPILFLGLVSRKTFLAAATEATSACSSSFSKNYWQTLSSRMSSTSGSYTAGSGSICYVTTPNEESAKKIATDLVSNKLAACVNIIPNIQSVYEWEGKINASLASFCIATVAMNDKN